MKKVVFKKKRGASLLWCLMLFLCVLWSGVACQPPATPEGADEERPQEVIIADRDAGPPPEPTPSEERAESVSDTLTGPLQLLDHTQWKPPLPADDPFRKMWPNAATCEGDFAWHLDKDALEIDTEICNFVTLQQPLLHAVRKGDKLKLGLWHVQLYSEGVAEAVVTLQAQETVIWTRTIPIPAKADYYEPTLEAPADIPKGVPLYIHVHNHGFNSWYLLYLAKVP